MFGSERIIKGYGDYRESIGRPRVNTLENLKESIPFNHFKAGMDFVLAELAKEGFFNTEDLPEDNAEDAL